MSDEQFATDFDPLMACRAADPVTSVMAAEKAGQFANTHIGRILEAFWLYGDLTSQEISYATGLTVVQIDRRLPNLKKAERAAVVKDGPDDMVRNGCRVWRASF